MATIDLPGTISNDIDQSAASDNDAAASGDPLMSAFHFSMLSCDELFWRAHAEAAIAPLLMCAVCYAPLRESLVRKPAMWA